MTILAQIETATAAIDHAAEKGGAWFLVAAVFCLAIAIVWMARRDQARHDKVCARLDEVQDKHTEFLEKIVPKVMQALDHNSSAMLQFSHALSPLTRILEANGGGRHNDATRSQ